MSKNFVIAILILMNLALGFICGAYSITADILLKTNEALMTEPEPIHPIHDADLTIWRYDNGDITIMVNGMFPHNFENFCVRI